MCNAALRRLIAVMRSLMQRKKHFFAKHGGNDDTRRNGALCETLQERVFDDELTAPIDERLQRGAGHEFIIVETRVCVQ